MAFFGRRIPSVAPVTGRSLWEESARDTSIPAGRRDFAALLASTVTGAVTVNVAPAEGRQLFGELDLVTHEGAVVARGTVPVGIVT
ncbi:MULTISPECIES: hypothetical protein [unclassified Micromonospora]|uniref:hypothetical protein n=1 Tax=unclassified Micromonospora TaxID=2617518 RepID=UPI002FEF721A